VKVASRRAAAQRGQNPEDIMTNVVTIRKAESKDRGALEVCFGELQSFER
jgi:hypothetical protein